MQKLTQMFKNKNMKKYLLFIFFFILCCNSFSKGRSGHYLICGTMYENKAKGKIIPNAIFLINGDKILTNERGEFEYQVQWETVCPFKLNFIQEYFYIKKQNPKWIIFQYQDKTFKISNKWRKYGLKNESRKEKLIYRKNISW